MTLSLYGMDVGFYSHIGAYPLRTRCEMLAELGYQSTNLTLWSEPAWADLASIEQEAAAAGLSVASLYLTIDLSAPIDSAETARALDVIRRHGHLPIELTFTLSAPEPAGPGGAEESVRRFLDSALRESERQDGQLRLYPHFAFWMERVDDAIAVCDDYRDPRLGITFPAFHVYALEGSGTLAALDRVAPYLRGVNTNGSRRLAGQYFPVTIEPVGEGDLDNFALLGRLRELDYQGDLGIQAYGIGGDPMVTFRRSRDAVHDIESRLDRHPEWAILRADTL